MRPEQGGGVMPRANIFDKRRHLGAKSAIATVSAAGELTRNDIHVRQTPKLVEVECRRKCYASVLGWTASLEKQV